MIRRFFLAWRAVGRTFGAWLLPPLIACGFVTLRIVISLGQLADRVFFPQVARVDVSRPVLLVGNPRSGTTFLHRWLDANGVASGTPLWRLMWPSLTIQTLVRPLLPALEAVSPAKHHAAAAHETSLVSPETDDVALLWRFFDGFFVYGFLLAWLDEDLVTEFERDNLDRDLGWWDRVWARQLVATGASRVAAKPFSLSNRLPAFLARRPDARVLYLLRDPLETVPSGLSLVSGVLEGFFGFWSRPEALRHRWAHRVSAGLVRLLRAFRDDWVAGRLPPHQVRIVRYDRLMTDFDGEMRDICAFLGHPVDEALARAIADTASKQRAHRSKHQYDLAKFGLDLDTLREETTFVADLYQTNETEASGTTIV